MENTVISSIEQRKVIVIVRGVEREHLIPLAEAMYAGGVRLMEITYDASEKVSDEEIAENIAMLTSHFGDRMIIGAGTVLTEYQVDLTMKAGGRFIISPNTDRDVIWRTRVMEMVSIPGALTPTEVHTAHTWGADFVKLFPIGSMGTDYLKAISAPLSHVRFLAVGGIDQTNVKTYLKAGAKGFGIGSGIVKKEWLHDENYAEITKLAREYVLAIESF